FQDRLNLFFFPLRRLYEEEPVALGAGVQLKECGFRHQESALKHTVLQKCGDGQVVRVSTVIRHLGLFSEALAEHPLEGVLLAEAVLRILEKLPRIGPAALAGCEQEAASLNQ